LNLPIIQIGLSLIDNIPVDGAAPRHYCYRLFRWSRWSITYAMIFLKRKWSGGCATFATTGLGTECRRGTQDACATSGDELVGIPMQSAFFRSS